ncbi:polysaccharide biosynthesis tyrosine autokinase [Pedobacter polaris]|uniref:non-specific protein-tyrosine kinase n=1 Tax=Pedobacter polaris TaxID=2571273 RepID=A0A4U1CZM1_9SPHI|nr:tyrosine-protein kinase [Pedobacter polaris]TKC13058.1 polysaccharide biosynthesis tyrosine autokinase [Pedobacter polaris]
MINSSNNNIPSDNRNNDEISIDLKQILAKLIDKWIWFVVSVPICLLATFLYVRYTAPIYQINSKLLVIDQGKGGSAAGKVSGLMDLGGLMGNNNSVENEVEILKSRFLVEQVVREMNLNIVYNAKGKIGVREIYNPPFILEIVKRLDTIQDIQLKVEKFGANKFKVITNGIEKEVLEGEIFTLNNIGQIKLISNPIFTFSNNEYLVDIHSLDSRVASLMANITVAPVNKQVSIINLGLKYPVPQKGEDILNVLIKKYTQANISDKNAIADSTGKFIKERLAVISGELSGVENNVEDYKQKFKLADMSEQGKLLVQTTGQLTSELAAAETQVSILNQLEEYLKDEANNKRVFPSSLIAQDLVFSNMMSQYNALLLEREKLLLGVTEESPFVQNIDTQIIGLRRGILSNIQSAKNSVMVTRNRLRNQLSSAEGQINSVPAVEKNYLQLARNQQIKQELYIFLMQKAEETAISKTANMAIAKIVDPPKSSVVPISPKKNVIYLFGFLAGIILPSGLIFLREVLNVSIKVKEDVSGLTRVPIVGEISHNLSDDNLIVANQSRSAISEQFRALRTNLSFYLKNVDEKVILLTSSMSGEGKSFTAINLGNILALAGKKVLLMEMDLRKPGLAVKLGIANDIGFSNYTIREDIKIADIIKPLAINKNMFFISSGPLPPNPAETIMSEHTAPLMEELKKQFDYIILDAPPVGIIADAQLLANYADVTLYLVRQGVTKKDQLKIVEDLYQANKMKNMGIVVNDISGKYDGYGYGYGNYGQEKEQGWFKKLVKLK